MHTKAHPLALPALQYFQNKSSSIRLLEMIGWEMVGWVSPASRLLLGRKHQPPSEGNFPADPSKKTVPTTML